MPSRTRKQHAKPAGFTPETLALRDALRRGGKRLAKLDWGGRACEVRALTGSAWLIVRDKDGAAFALRLAPSADAAHIRCAKTDAGADLEIDAAEGRFAVSVSALEPDLIRVTTRLTPAENVLVPFWPRDFYPLSADDDPTQAKGWVEAAQRGVNSGLCYLCIESAKPVTALYFQNLTALNPYFQHTKAKPDGVVGGEWPELGYLPPGAPRGPSPPREPLPAGEQVTLSDALIALRDGDIAEERACAARFLEMLGQIYRYLETPTPAYHDWIGRAERTIRDLTRSKKASVEFYGCKYVRPYVDAEHPDSMVQLTILSAFQEYAAATGKDLPLRPVLQAGLSRFYDRELKALRRYLPNVGKDKNRNAVDSWYLYHPMVSLGVLAEAGDAEARKLFFDSIDYGIKAARHFKYKWPIQFDIRNFKVIDAARNDEGLGQTDVGGIYAYVMLVAHAMSGDDLYIREAKAALKALEGYRFELVYQTNLTAWGAVACLRLWRQTQERAYFDQSLVFLAGFLHNCEIWESEIEHAKNYANFLGVTCLHDAPYMAAYECFDSVRAFDEYLRVGGDDLPPSVRLLLCEYNRFAFDRAWYYYPDTLPGEVLADKEKIRNGHIDCKLSFPLEDLYGDGQPPGQVGQEVYGCGGALSFAARYHRLSAFGLCLFIDCPADVEAGEAHTLNVRLKGPEGKPAYIRVLRHGRRALPVFAVVANGETLAPQEEGDGFRAFVAPADAQLKIVLLRRGRAASAGQRETSA